MKLVRNTLATALIGTFVLTGCTPTDVATSDPSQRTKEGAIAGGITGALIGIATGDSKDDRRRGAVIGGIVGATTGAIIGSNLDKQAAELQSSMDGRVQIIRSDDQLIVRMPQDILFATDSTAVSGALVSDLQTLASSLNRYPNTIVTVVGHTDNVGAAAYNMDLSNRRASAVASILISSGVGGGRVRAQGMGEDSPIASNSTESGRALNRRVDIIITER